MSDARALWRGATLALAVAGARVGVSVTRGIAPSFAPFDASKRVLVGVFAGALGAYVLAQCAWVLGVYVAALVRSVREARAARAWRARGRRG